MHTRFSRRRFGGVALGGALFSRLGVAQLAGQVGLPPSQDRHRVLVSTDIGGSDPDDFQSMVHFLVCADLFDVEGLVSSPWGPGRKEHILEVIDRYEIDYPNLKTHSERFPSPETLRSLSKQGATEFALGQGFGEATEGSDWIIECAKRDDPRPLYVLAWGLIEDVAQALHDDPSIKDKLRVYFIAGPNKKWGVAAYNYIEEQHPDLWIIENNSTYRGWFNGGDQTGDLGNESFVKAHIAGHGALGEYFDKILSGVIKMGDTPSVVYMMGTPGDPTRESWGGRFVRAWQRPKKVFRRLTTSADEIEVFGILEMDLEGPADDAGVRVSMIVDGQEFPGTSEGEGVYRVRFSPKAVDSWSFRIESNSEELDGLTGEFTSVAPAPDSASRPDARHPNWWTDDPDPQWSVGEHHGAKTVSRWREEFLRDFQKRMEWCAKAQA